MKKGEGEKVLLSLSQQPVGTLVKSWHSVNHDDLNPMAKYRTVTAMTPEESVQRVGKHFLSLLSIRHTHTHYLKNTHCKIAWKMNV